MLDCGESAQRQFRLQRLNFQRLVAIFISHLHGDHCFGLPGLLSTLGLLGRTGDLEIYGPRGLKDFLDPIADQFLQKLPYKLIVRELDHKQSEEIYEDRSVSIRTIPLSHKMPTLGFILKEKRAELHLDKAAADFYQLPRSAYPKVLQGEDYLNSEGEVIPNERLTKKGAKAKSYAYLSDTAFMPKKAELLEGVSLLYHEATFLSKDQSRAKATGHSTAAQAGQMASLAGVDRLLIGHYSARYKDFKDLLLEAQAVFPHTEAAQEGQTIDL